VCCRGDTSGKYRAACRGQVCSWHEWGAFSMCKWLYKGSKMSGM